MIIIPSITPEKSSNPTEVQAELDRFAQFHPRPQVIHQDIVDGEFADMITIEPSMLRGIDTTGWQIDLHLMTQEPIDFLGELQGVPNIRRIIAQVERMHSVPEFIDIVTEDLGAEVGLALDLFTSFEDLQEEISDLLDQVSVVQVMGNQAGVQGQEIHPASFETLRAVAEYKAHHDLGFEIAFDIGMNSETMKQVEQLGATEVVMGSYLYGVEGAQRWAELNKR